MITTSISRNGEVYANRPDGTHHYLGEIEHTGRGQWTAKPRKGDDVVDLPNRKAAVDYLLSQ